MTRVSADPLADAQPRSYWHDLHDAGPTTPPLAGDGDADLVVIGGGFTGLWTAITAKRRHPNRDVLVLESEYVGHGATGRNGGFVSESLTHGLAHGLAAWPDQVDALTALGRDNLAGLQDDVRAQGIAADLRLNGKTLVAITTHQADGLPALAALLAAHGEDVTLLDADQVRADVASPTYLGGVRIRSGGGTLDPLGLAVGLRDWALRLGVRLHERTPARSLDTRRVHTPHGQVRARQVAVVTNAYPAPVRRLRKYIVPVYDHVLVTEPLSEAQWAGVGWAERQGLTDAGNQFHYYRPLSDGRILWGGYDAIYYYGSATDGRAGAARVLAPAAGRALPADLPAAGGRPVHAPLGRADRHLLALRPVPAASDRSGTVAHAIGFTGLGVAYSRFAAGGAARRAGRRPGAGLPDQAASAVPARAAALPRGAADPRRARPRGRERPTRSVAAHARSLRRRLQLLTDSTRPDREDAAYD